MLSPSEFAGRKAQVLLVFREAGESSVLAEARLHDEGSRSSAVAVAMVPVGCRSMGSRFLRALWMWWGKLAAKSDCRCLALSCHVFSGEDLCRAAW